MAPSPGPGVGVAGDVACAAGAPCEAVSDPPSGGRPAAGLTLALTGAAWKRVAETPLCTCQEAWDRALEPLEKGFGG